MGASAVLVFCVPASPMAQPWAVVGGNTVSARHNQVLDVSRDDLQALLDSTQNDVVAALSAQARPLRAGA